MYNPLKMSSVTPEMLTPQAPSARIFRGTLQIAKSGTTSKLPFTVVFYIFTMNAIYRENLL